MATKRKRQIININSELTSSIIEIIFSKLPFYSLPSCRIVCKEWNDLISICKFDSQIFIYNLFIDHICGNLVCVEFDPKPKKEVKVVASFNFHPKLFSPCIDFSILNSCNGIFCLLIKKFTVPYFVCLLNPMTNEYFELQISKAERTKNYYYRLGFSPKTKQYKLVRSSFILHENYGNGTLIEISTFGTTPKWNIVDFLPYFFSTNNFIYFNGGLYFVTDGEDSDSFIYRLDLESEKMKKISYPIDEGLFHQIVELNGTLYLSILFFDCHFHVWKMWEEDFSWIKAFVFPVSDRSIYFNLLKVYEDGKIFCGYRYFGFELILYQYDPMSKTKEIYDDHQDPKITRIKSFHQIGSPNFSSLSKILVGN